jgi:hypothetical protein
MLAEIGILLELLLENLVVNRIGPVQVRWKTITSI